MPLQTKDEAAEKTIDLISKITKKVFNSRMAGNQKICYLIIGHKSNIEHTGNIFEAFVTDNDDKQPLSA